MKKENIVKKNTDFDRIIRTTKPYRFKDYIIYNERTTNDKYKFGFSVGKKMGNAVTRNRIKRQLRSIVAEKNYQNGINCIIIVGKGILDRSFKEMKENLFEAFNKLNLTKEK